MLETINLSKKLSKEEYKIAKKKYKQELYSIQKYLYGEKVPMIILFEGLESAGKGSIIENLLEFLDPRGFKVIPVYPATEEEKSKPFLYRFWIDTPLNGKIHLFDRSWYMHVLDEKVYDQVNKTEVSASLNEINEFERTLYDNGTHILKFWLHISKKEQKKRLKKMEKSEDESYRVTKKEWKEHKHYKDFIRAAEEMMAKTNTTWAPWNIVPTEDLRYGKIYVMKTIIQTIEATLGKVFQEKMIESIQSNDK